MVAAQIFCPHCGIPISIAAACGVTRLREAMRLQAERFGVEAICTGCQEGFLYTKFRPTARPEPVRFNRQD